MIQHSTRPSPKALLADVTVLWPVRRNSLCSWCTTAWVDVVYTSGGWVIPVRCTRKSIAVRHFSSLKPTPE